MIKKKITTVESPLKVFCSIQADSGNSARQVYNAAGGEYYPDRNLAPLTLKPLVGYKDPSTGLTVSDAAAELTSGQWYRLTKSGKATSTSGGLIAGNELTNSQTITGADGNPTARVQINTTVGNANYGQIKIYENCPAGDTVTYVFVAKLSRTGQTVSASFKVSTQTVDVMPQLYFDNDTNHLYDPLTGARYFEITPHVIPDTLSATFAWKTYHENAWGALDSTHFDWALKVTGDTLKIDRQVMQDSLRIKCVATVNVGGVNMALEGVISHTRRMPRFWYDITRANELTPGAKTFSPFASIWNQKGPVTSVTEFKIGWYSGSTLLSSAQAPSLSLSALGTSGELGLDVKDAGGWKALTTADGKILTTADGKILIAR